MYYRLGGFGRFVWNMTALLLWIVVTFLSMQWLMGLAVPVVQQGHHTARSIGVNPAVGDVGNVFMAAIIFFVVPVLTTILTLLVNKLVKGRASCKTTPLTSR